MKNVILIRSRAIDPSVYKIAGALSKNGYKAKVLIWARAKEKPEELGVCYNVSCFNMKAPYDKISVAFYLPFWWLYELFYLLTNLADIVHACDLDTLIPAIFVKKIKKFKLCYTIYDFYADNLPHSLSVLRKLVGQIERMLIGFCDAVFIVDPARYEQIRGAKIKRLSVLYNSPPDFIRHNEVCKQLKPKMTSELTMFYAGLIHRSRGLFNLLKAIEEVDGVKLIVAGKGPDIEIFEKFLNKLKNKVKYIGFISYEEVIKRTSEADVIIALYDLSVPNNRYASPNKLFEAMMCSKPIIVNRGIVAAKIVEREKCGLVISYDNINSIKRAIVTLMNNPCLRLKLGENGRKAYEKRYAWEIMEKNLIKIYRELSTLC
jgi:glycosyltransferase involved in cell wall biosynthesis